MSDFDSDVNRFVRFISVYNRYDLKEHVEDMVDGHLLRARFIAEDRNGKFIYRVDSTDILVEQGRSIPSGRAFYSVTVLD